MGGYMRFNRVSFVAIAALAATLLFAPPSHATGFQPVSQEELKMTSEPKAPGAPAVILFRQDDCDDNGLTSHENEYYRIKILTEAGRNRANVEIGFGKEESLVNVKGRTIEPDGSIVNFDGKVFEKEVVKARGIKYRAKTFTLP
ncbi:MAG: DUF3857 domain-containing protein, partial [Acidobacteriales bacterium]|nr:DUF3857 domain-containing protein [Terriglobales bacterium]